MSQSEVDIQVSLYSLTQLLWTPGFISPRTIWTLPFDSFTPASTYITDRLTVRAPAVTAAAVDAVNNRCGHRCFTEIPNGKSCWCCWKSIFPSKQWDTLEYLVRSSQGASVKGSDRERALTLKCHVTSVTVCCVNHKLLVKLPKARSVVLLNFDLQGIVAITSFTSLMKRRSPGRSALSFVFMQSNAVPRGSLGCSTLSHFIVIEAKKEGEDTVEEITYCLWQPDYRCLSGSAPESKCFSTMEPFLVPIKRVGFFFTFVF